MHITFADVERARPIITPIVRRTPLLSSAALGERIGASAFLKAENLQRTGSFKPRGAVNAMLTLTDEQRRGGVVTMSAGNAAQAIAFAGRQAGAKVTVVMPETAVRSKVEATRGYGAEIVFKPDVTQLAAAVEEIRARTGAHSCIRTTIPR